VRPAVPPPDLDLDQLFSSLEAMRRMDPARVLFSHFGPSPDGAVDLVRYRTIVEEWRDVALAAARENPDVAFVTQRLRAHDATGGPITPRGASTPEERSTLVNGYDLAAQGFLRFFETHGFLSQGMG
jgi:glyoxylase-like metal-dependent hydrolase (beta-lactamase superfamily II)